MSSSIRLTRLLLSLVRLHGRAASLTLQLAVLDLIDLLDRRLVDLRARREAGQTTAEYALIILGAATVALLVVAWATKTSKVGKLLDAVVDSVISKVT